MFLQSVQKCIVLKKLNTFWAKAIHLVKFKAAIQKFVRKSMKPLYTNKQALIWLCAFSSDETPNGKSTFAHISFTMFVMGTYVCFLGASIAYFIKYATIDLNETLYVLIQILAALPMMKALVIMIFLRDKFTALFESLTAIYDACKWIWVILKLWDYSFSTYLILIHWFQSQESSCANFWMKLIRYVNGCGWST